MNLAEQMKSDINFKEVISILRSEFEKGLDRVFIPSNLSNGNIDRLKKEGFEVNFHGQWRENRTNGVKIEPMERLNRKMKKIILFTLTTLFISCGSVEERIKDYSYTDKWYYVDTMRFQVYKTKSGREYIIILNDNETKFIRKYIK